MIDKNDIITFNNSEYLVISKVEYENLTYLYLVDIIDNTNIKFVSVDNDEVVIVTDNDLLNKLFKLIINDLKSDLI